LISIQGLLTPKIWHDFIDRILRTGGMRAEIIRHFSGLANAPVLTVALPGG